MSQLPTYSTLEDIRPPHPLVDLGLSSHQIIWIGGGLLFLLILILLLVLWLKKKKKNEREISFYEIALQTLDSIAANSKISDERWTVLVSECVRTYFEKTLKLPAPERTTEEFLSSLSDHALFQSQEMTRMLENFLKKCDLVKFAKQSLNSNGRLHLMQYARDLVKLSNKWLIKKAAEEEAIKKAQKTINPSESLKKSVTIPTLQSERKP